MTVADDSPLFPEFDAVSREEWLEAIEQSLRGRSLDSLTKRSYEGIDLFPVATADELAGSVGCDSLPGQYPFRRGTRAAGYRARPWLIAQEIALPDPQAFNQALREALRGGQTAIVLDACPRMQSSADWQVALCGVDLGATPLFLAQGARALTAYALLRAAVPEEALARLSGCIGYDPLGQLAQAGLAPRDLFERMLAHVTELNQRSPRLGSIAVRADVYHEAGANAVQELAIALATGVAYLRELTARGLEIDQVAGKLHFFLGVGENFFMEIAKLRAIKLMWAQVARAFGGSAGSQKINLHARCGGRNKSRLDPHNNLLRATSEAMAAALAGVDSIMTLPFDAPLARSMEGAEGFSRRLARNLQLIMQAEARLTEIIDPAGGAWHIEKLTDQLAQAAWKMFQDIEAGGGALAALRAGSLQAQIKAVAQERQRDLAQGKTVLVGLNRYVNSEETAASLQQTPGGDKGGSADAKQAPASTQSAAERDAIIVKPLQPLRLAEPLERRLMERNMMERRLMERRMMERDA